MNALNKLTIKNLKLNKKRAIGTIIGIVLSVALICAVSNMVSSFRETLVQNAINETGYYHIKLTGITSKDLSNLELNKDIKNINILYTLGYSYIDLNDDEYPYIEINSLDKSKFSELSYQIVEGRLPNNNSEIVISSKIKLKSNYKIGDTITLDIGERKTSDGYELDNQNPYVEENEEIIDNAISKTYQIVGIIYKDGVDNDYYGITTNEKPNNISAYIALKNPRDYESSFMEILGANSYSEVENHNIQNLKYNYSINNELLIWEAFKFSDSTFNMLTSVAGVVILIIIFTSVFCIRNSFAISTTEKMKMYGMLSSVGATKKQIKKSVLSEGFILGLIAIPLGILCGILAVFILIKIVNIILSDFLFNNIDGIVFKISLISVLISIILGFVTIYFSAISSARKASRVSPIDNLRSTNEIKINAKKLHTPKIIKKLFKTGGTLAYKNLKRSKKKYRTTVISLTVSIFVFISMFAFIEEGFKQAGNYYHDLDYNMAISLDRDYSIDKIKKIEKLDNVDNSYLLYESYSSLKITDLSKINQTDDGEQLNCEYDENNNCIDQYVALSIILMDDETFHSYVKKLNGNYDELKNKGILVDNYMYYSKKKGEKKAKWYKDRRYKYKVGDIIDTTFTNNENMKVEIGKVSDIRPYGMENVYYSGGYLVLNNKYFTSIDCYPYKLLIYSNNNEQLIKDMNEIDEELNFYDLEEAARVEKSMVLVISIFLYGFIGVITLIGVTNIFNTITSNMELRQKEFAMLKSVGMTKKEFNRMINLETLFYSTKSLIYGTILGVIGAFAIHKAFGTKLETVFVLPYKAIIISIIFVFIIVYMIMKYSISKINKQNTIETIRNENV